MKFIRISVVFLLLVRVFSFYFTKPLLHHGDRVKLSSVLMTEPKIGFGRLEFKLNDELVVISRSQNVLRQINVRDWTFRKITVEGKVVCSQFSVLGFQLSDTSLPVVGQSVTKGTGKQKTGKPISENRPASPELQRGEKLRTDNRDFCYISAFSLRVEPANVTTRVLLFFNSIRQFVIKTCFALFPPDEAGIMIGILLGESGFVSHNMYEAFKNAGVLHLFAASGMNLVIFGGFVRQSLIIFMKRRKAEGLALISVVFYVFLSGFSPSILRAAVMYCLIFGASVFGRPISARQNLFYAVLALVFVNPELIFNLGFQLSVLATMGLIVSPCGKGVVMNGHRPFSAASDAANLDQRELRLAERVSAPRELRAAERAVRVHYNIFSDILNVFLSDFQTSFSCFLFTAPLIIFSFKQINLLSIAVNVLVLWTVDILMIGGVIVLILQAIGFAFVKLVSFPIFALILFFKQTVLLFSSYKFGVINLSWQGDTVLFLIFCLTYWIGFLLKTEKRANGEAK